MIRIILFLVISLISKTNFAQNIKVTYSARLTENFFIPDSIPTEYYATRVEEMNSQIKQAVTKIDIVVISGKDEYQVYTKQQEFDDLLENDYNLATSLLLGGPLIHADLVDQVAFYEPRTLEVLRQIDMKNIIWKVTEEEKLINGIKAVKAISEVKKSDLEYKQQIPITCWFAPSIEFQGGPTAYSTLPGLILQLETFKVLYEIKKIEEGSFEFKPVNPKNLDVKFHLEFTDYYNDWNPKS